MNVRFFRAIVAASLLAAGITSASAQAYKVTNLLSDGSVPATTIDANFINPWGMSVSGTWWISTPGSGFNYVVPAAGTVSFKVIVPLGSNPTTAGLPAGSVTTGGAVGMLLSNGTKASFIFSTLDGTISGWNSKLGTANALSLIAVNNSAAGASYTGLALLNVQNTSTTPSTTSASYLLATNFGSGSKVEVYDSTFAASKLTGSFTDPNLPTGYSPFSIHILGSQIYVAYALKGTNGRATFGLGNGIVDTFDLNGNFVARAVTGGNLNAPWGVAIAPANFGIFSNDLLIGNQGDGLINVYDPKTFAYLGQLADNTGKSLAYLNLWDILPGASTVAGTTAVSAGDPSTLYFVAGLTGETHGLLGAIANTTTAGSTPTFGFTSSTTTNSVTAGGQIQTTLSLAPVNGFSGTVSLACSGLPTGASCSFSPATVNVASTAASTATVTVLTTKASVTSTGGMTAALLLPFAALFAFRRRHTLGKAATSLTVLTMLCGSLAIGMLSGCSNNTVTPVAATPAGTSNIVITATAGAVSQTTTVALTVK